MKNKKARLAFHFLASFYKHNYCNYFDHMKRNIHCWHLNKRMY